MKKISLSMSIFASVFVLFLPVHTGISAEDLDALKERAEQGDTDAQLDLGRMYFDERGDMPPDYPRAAAWFKKAAKQGDADAQYQIGYMYYHGLGVPEDQARAAAWLEKAAEQGHADAQRNLEIIEEVLKVGQ